MNSFAFTTLGLDEAEKKKGSENGTNRILLNFLNESLPILLAVSNPSLSLSLSLTHFSLFLSFFLFIPFFVSENDALNHSFESMLERSMISRIKRRLKTRSLMKLIVEVLVPYNRCVVTKTSQFLLSPMLRISQKVKH